MSTDRKHQAPTVAPGEPEAPVAGEVPAPAPSVEAAPSPEDQQEPEVVPEDQQEPEVVPEDQQEPEAVPEDHEHKVRRDLEELAAKAGKADEYLKLAQRTKADFENYRKRATREAAAAQERGVVKLARELLPAVDNLDRALEAAEAASSDGPNQAQNGASPLVSGIKLVHADVIAALARVGIEAFSPQGERFDPQHHEAVAQQPVDGAEPGTIVEVYQRGYRLGDSVLRPARVVVAA
jgi:molecular chaperone GrpE